MLQGLFCRLQTRLGQLLVEIGQRRDVVVEDVWHFQAQGI